MNEAFSNDGRLARLPWRPLVWGGAAALYAVPVVAWLAVPGMLWDGADFVFAAVLIFGAALMVEIGLRLSRDVAYRAGVAVAVGAAFLTVWANGAVGMIGDEDNPLNLMYLAALAAMALAALAARCRAAALSKIAWAMAATQFAIAAVAQYHGHFVWVIAAFFATIWATSGWLFAKAQRAGSG
ncbi:hypothetical protein [Pelagerythrobacter sp.]|uniref:hypothetical protein n=1 Tax=Pelagerythrobacter sp. TaxID=2800702 RepID=UPI0035AE4F76